MKGSNSLVHSIFMYSQVCCLKLQWEKRSTPCFHPSSFFSLYLFGRFIPEGNVVILSRDEDLNLPPHYGFYRLICGRVEPGEGVCELLNFLEYLRSPWWLRWVSRLDCRNATWLIYQWMDESSDDRSEQFDSDLQWSSLWIYCWIVKQNIFTFSSLFCTDNERSVVLREAYPILYRLWPKCVKALELLSFLHIFNDEFCNLWLQDWHI